MPRKIKANTTKGIKAQQVYMKLQRFWSINLQNVCQACHSISASHQIPCSNSSSIRTDKIYVSTTLKKARIRIFE